MVKDMTEGGSTKLILSFAVPLMLGNLLQQAYSLIDAAIVGHYLGMNALVFLLRSSSVPAITAKCARLFTMLISWLQSCLFL